MRWDARLQGALGPFERLGRGAELMFAVFGQFNAGFSISKIRGAFPQISGSSPIAAAFENSGVAVEGLGEVDRRQIALLQSAFV